MEFLKSPLPVTGNVVVTAMPPVSIGQLPATQAETYTSETKACSSAAPVAFSDVVLDFPNGPINDPMVMLVHCEKVPGLGAGDETVDITLEMEFPVMSMVAAGSYSVLASHVQTQYFSFVLNDLTFGADAITQPYLFDVNFIKKIKSISVASTSGTPHNVTLVFMSPRGVA